MHTNTPLKNLVRIESNFDNLPLFPEKERDPRHEVYAVGDMDPSNTDDLGVTEGATRRNGCSNRAAGVAVIATVLMSGCVNSPSIGVLGAYFPDWLFCIVAGVALTVVIYLILKRLQVDDLLGPSAVVYPTLVTFLSLAVWLLLFQH
ncbi:conserved membrane hypothetical protein [Paraburkholderia piptadeniae]|uniref:Uncharacterized protein YtcA n=1 Tax=Paraburkholderia piptadeniae TaxID=1701573 RepID=A0A1N7S2R1_9BURK|nr:conserved membrane hypothetical protein [Paraburkholderia piptadeniae]